MIRIISSFLIASSLLIGCAKNPLTGRNQAKLVSETELQSMATTQYQQFLSTNKVVSSSSNRDAEMVKRVGQRITKAVTQYYAQQGLSSRLEGSR